MTTTYKLAAPIEFEGKTYDELTLREPELGDAMAADAYPGEMHKIAAVLAAICGVPLGVIAKLPISQIAALSEKANIAEVAK